MRFALLIFWIVTSLFGQAVPLHIKTAAAAFQAGEDAANKKEFEQAIGYFRKAIEIEPTFRNAFESLSAAFLSAGRRSEAAATLTKLLQIEPDLTPSRVLLGHLLLEANERQRALAQFSLALKYNPLDADALLGFASAAKLAGMNDRAMDALTRGRNQYPSDARFKAESR